jgi:hypothetical protein
MSVDHASETGPSTQLFRRLPQTRGTVTQAELRDIRPSMSAVGVLSLLYLVLGYVYGVHPFQRTIIVPVEIRLARSSGASADLALKLGRPIYLDVRPGDLVVLDETTTSQVVAKTMNGERVSSLDVRVPARVANLFRNVVKRDVRITGRAALLARVRKG